MLVLAGCAGAPPAGPGAPRREAPLNTERKWLQSWFRDTPVRITQDGDGPVSVEVPREFCFERGRSSVRPALAAVLDKLAESLRRTPTARLDLIAAPGDTAAPSPLPLQRASQLRAHLLSRGVPAKQLGQPSATDEAAVQLRLVLSVS